MTDARFDALLDAWFDGCIAAEDLAAVQAALADPAQQQRFLARCRLEGALRRSGAAVPSAPRRPIAFPVAGALLAAAAITLLLLPGAPAAADPPAASTRRITARVAGDGGSWAVATQPAADAEGALALHFIPIVTHR